MLQIASNQHFNLRLKIVLILLLQFFQLMDPKTKVFSVRIPSREINEINLLLNQFPELTFSFLVRVVLLSSDRDSVINNLIKHSQRF